MSQRGGESCLGTYFFSWYHGTYHVRKNCVLDLKIGHGTISVPTRYPAWENVMFNVTCENQRRADERIPILLDLPFKHKGIMCAPFIGPVSIKEYLPYDQIEQVYCDGENYNGARPCHYEWVKNLHDECKTYNVTFVFCGTGRRFVKDGKIYKIEGTGLQSEQALKSGLSFQGKPIEFKLTDEWGWPIPEENLYKPYFGPRCLNCGMRLTCNGCSRCGKCKGPGSADTFS